ncbi:MAG: Sjogren's syndrome/scleroderma autoantigen 1 family protein [Halobacteriales archaeon]|nr:Sjogren's syndrome/scleroderma autoantigen 1 family protein [Halobacteriales archaeon]
MTNEEETQAMSRLLTRGAKMLQEGCDDCGNPLFRYSGEVVCPVCNERRSTDAEDADDDEEVCEETTDTTDTDRAEDASTTEDSDAADTRKRDTKMDEHLRVLAKKLARDAVERSDDIEAVERRLDALERTLGLLSR